MRKTLICPCGQQIIGDNEDDLVAQARAHLAGKHPELADDYSREEILLFAY